MTSTQHLTQMADNIGHVQGWDIYAERDNDERDCRKTDFFAVHEDTGEVKTVDVSPYSDPTLTDLTRLADLGFPRRIGICPLSSIEIELLWLRQEQARTKQALSELLQRLSLTQMEAMAGAG